MTSGNINLAGSTLTLGTADIAPGTLSHGGTSASGWMYGGNFTRYFNAVTIANGAVAGLFPIGSDIYFRPFYVSCPTVGPTTGGTATLSHTNSGNVSIVSFADDFTVARRFDAFWTLATNGMTDGTYNLRAEGIGFGVIGNVNDIRLTLSNSVVGTPGINAGTTSNPQINRTGLTLAQLSNNFYIASVDENSSPLPIELLSFDAILTDQAKINVFWTTATERNNDYFTVEKSTDGLYFEIVSKVKSAGNGTTIQNYSLTDDKPYTGISYYRLKQTDYDGNFSYSNLVAVNNLKNAISSTIYPNPSDGSSINVIVRGITENEEVILVLFDALGKQVYSKTVFNTNNVDYFFTTVDLENISPGIYYVVASSGNELFRNKLLITGTL